MGNVYLAGGDGFHNAQEPQIDVNTPPRKIKTSKQLLENGEVVFFSRIQFADETKLLQFASNEEAFERVKVFFPLKWSRCSS